jgi:hypothetical protein
MRELLAFLYGSDTHAEAAAAIFSAIASCRLHGLDPFQYLEGVLRVLPYWPSNRYLSAESACKRGHKKLEKKTG